jgi:hypothetical protein
MVVVRKLSLLVTEAGMVELKIVPVKRYAVTHADNEPILAYHQTLLPKLMQQMSRDIQLHPGRVLCWGYSLRCEFGGRKRVWHCWWGRHDAFG